MVESRSRRGRDPKGAARAHLVEATIEGGWRGGAGLGPPPPRVAVCDPPPPGSDHCGYPALPRDFSTFLSSLA